jgi:PIN domain nuclease of toxin-antitoxin system
VQVVADTHAAVWYLTNHPNLSKKAGQAMDSVTGLETLWQVEGHAT